MDCYFILLVGFVLGVSEYVVDVIVNFICECGNKVSVLLELNIDDIDDDIIWIVCILIYGVGDLFENIQFFVK